MWRKALVLGLVLMTIGMVVGGAVEEGKVAAGYGLYRWHKTGNVNEFYKGAKAVLWIDTGGGGIATLALKLGMKTLAKATVAGLAVLSL